MFTFDSSFRMKTGKVYCKQTKNTLKISEGIMWPVGVGHDGYKSYFITKTPSVIWSDFRDHKRNFALEYNFLHWLPQFN